MTAKLLNRIRRYFHGDQSSAASPVQEDTAYLDRLENEKKHYAECLNVHELPEIFHYWSNRNLLPMFEPFGFTNPNDFFYEFIREKCEQAPDRDIAIVSVGAGNCDLEQYLGGKLEEAGIGNFNFCCIEINENMVERARQQLESTGLASKFTFLSEDFNKWRPERHQYDVVMANQSLHHVMELEHLFDSIAHGLAEDGVFLTSDMIGRNGHQRWPEALEMVNEFWKELPPEYRYNHLMKRNEKEYINHDCSTSGFEGIRAQDILPLLVERFNFSLFIPYGNIVFVFVDRTFGHNFNAQGEWDRKFIDRLQEADEQAILDGSIKPTSMLAAMQLKPCEPGLRHASLTPEFCVRNP